MKTASNGEVSNQAVLYDVLGIAWLFFGEARMEYYSCEDVDITCGTVGLGRR